LINFEVNDVNFVVDFDDDDVMTSNDEFVVDFGIDFEPRCVQS